MGRLEQHLKNGLKNGYNQNQVFHTSFAGNKNSIVEYLLTANVAQQLIEWNKEEKNDYSLYLEYPTEKFFKNAFLPYMDIGDGLFDVGITHPEVIKSLKNNTSIRKGRIDIVICKGESNYSDFRKSIFGIELKGINPDYKKVIDDIKRLVLAIEMSDEDTSFNNSIEAGYCLFIKRLGGNKTISTETSLKQAMEKSIGYLKKMIDERIEKTSTKIDLITDIIKNKPAEEYNDLINREELTADVVSEGTQIMFSVLIKITREK